MSVNRFTYNSTFTWMDISYQVTEILPDQRFNIVDLQSGAFETVSEQTLLNALFDGDLYFSQADDSLSIVVRDSVRALDDCSERQQLTAKYRHWVIDDLARLEQRTNQDVLDRCGEVAKIIAMNAFPEHVRIVDSEGKRIRTSSSFSTVRRWMLDYAKAEYDIRALIPNTPAKGRKNYLSPDVEAILETVINELYMRREHVSYEDVHKETFLRVEEENTLRAPQRNQIESIIGRPLVTNEPITEVERSRLEAVTGQRVTEKQVAMCMRLTPPSPSTVYRRITALKIKSVYIATHGKQAADREFAQYGQMKRPDRPLIRVEADHSPCDTNVVDAEDGLPMGRPTLTCLLDTATKYPLGYYLGFEPPSYKSVMYAMAHAIRPKPDTSESHGTQNQWVAYGLWRDFAVDRGKEFKSSSLSDACASLGINPVYMPRRTPHFKGAIERIFRTVNDGVLHTIDGTTFSNIFAKGDYRSLQLAKLTLQDLDKALTTFLIDHYAQDFHRGIQGIPAKRWEAWWTEGFRPRLPDNSQDLDVILAHKEDRSLFHYGIEIDCLRYNHPDLLPLRMQLKKKEKVKVKIHPDDISKIHVYNHFDNTYITVPALDQEYVQGMSKYKHDIIRAFCRREMGKVNRAGLAKAKRRVREIVAQSKRNHRKITTRKKIARYEESGANANRIQSQSEPIQTPEKVAEPAVLTPVTVSDDEWEVEHVRETS